MIINNTYFKEPKTLIYIKKNSKTCNLPIKSRAYSIQIEWGNYVISNKMSCTAMHYYLSMRQILKTNPETTAYLPVEASRLECLFD